MRRRHAAGAAVDQAGGAGRAGAGDAWRAAVDAHLLTSSMSICSGPLGAGPEDRVSDGRRVAA